VASALQASSGRRITVDPVSGDIVAPGKTLPLSGTAKPRRKHRAIR